MQLPMHKSSVTCISIACDVHSKDHVAIFYLFTYKMIILIIETESSLLSVGPLSTHVDTLVLTDELNVLIAINEKVMSLMTLLHVFSLLIKAICENKHL